MTIERSESELSIINTVACPKCKAKKGWPCVYISPAITRYDSRPDPRVGFPTKRVHNERRERMQKKQRDEARATRMAEETAKWQEERNHLVAMRALRSFDMQEHAKMIEWLRTNVSIFFLEEG